MINLGSKIGDWEEIQRRKELATITLVRKKELENETDNQNPSVRDASEKYTVVQLRNLGCVKGCPEKNEQFS